MCPTPWKRATRRRLRRVVLGLVLMTSGLHALGCSRSDPVPPAAERSLQEAQIAFARAEVDFYCTYLDLYRFENGQIPETLALLHQKASWDVAPHLMDPWKRAYVYRLLAGNGFTIRSLGPDGQEDTADDLVCSRDGASVVARVPDAQVATARSYLQAKLRDETFAKGLGIESFDNAMVSLHSATEKEAWVRAIRERAADDPALKGVDIATMKIASVYFGDGGGPWLLVIVDPETGRPLTVVRMN